MRSKFFSLIKLLLKGTSYVFNNQLPSNTTNPRSKNASQVSGYRLESIEIPLQNIFETDLPFLQTVANKLLYSFCLLSEPNLKVKENVIPKNCKTQRSQSGGATTKNSTQIKQIYTDCLISLSV